MNGDGDLLYTQSDAAADKMQTVSEDALTESRLGFLTFDSTVAGVVASVIGWTTLYHLFCNYFTRDTSEWHCRLVTVLHASIVVALSAWSVFVQGPWPFTDPGSVSPFFVTHTCQQAWMRNSKFSQILLHLWVSRLLDNLQIVNWWTSQVTNISTCGLVNLWMPLSIENNTVFCWLIFFVVCRRQHHQLHIHKAEEQNVYKKQENAYLMLPYLTFRDSSPPIGHTALKPQQFNPLHIPDIAKVTGTWRYCKPR